ncbi:DUF2935 domain-containing protein [Sedimentibacter sp.]|uniref:DUF2935 domain-containing protein n=1 Tax=Sedimentibacter sp. TaxID=1960295 RepID=UPI0028AFAD9F|nr:DUF2935 domain-containing protein [Sedimentibacter sp.]
MRFFYGEKNVLRALEEADFWKRQESEHIDVIQEVVPDLEEEYVNRLDEYKEIFDSTHARIVQLMETAVNCHNLLSPEIYQNMISLINLAVRQSQVFIEFLSLLLRDSEAVKSNPTAGIVINHIRRESEYFIGVVTAFLTTSCNQQNDFMRDIHEIRDIKY